MPSHVVGPLFNSLVFVGLLLMILGTEGGKHLRKLTNEEIHTELIDQGWSETKVEKAEDCDRDKCPKMIDLCPEGGNCYVNGDCNDDGCFCHMRIACKNESSSHKEELLRIDETGDDYANDEDDEEVDTKQAQNLQRSKHKACLKHSPNQTFCVSWARQACQARNRKQCCKGVASNTQHWRKDCGEQVGDCQVDAEEAYGDNCCYELECGELSSRHQLSAAQDYSDDGEYRGHAVERFRGNSLNDLNDYAIENVIKKEEITNSEEIEVNTEEEIESTEEHYESEEAEDSEESQNTEESGALSGTDYNKESEAEDLLAGGEKIKEQKFDKGTKFIYCFDDFEACDHAFAIERCYQIRDKFGCKAAGTGCKYREKEGRCCLRYKCLPSDTANKTEETMKNEESGQKVVNEDNSELEEDGKTNRKESDQEKIEENNVEVEEEKNEITVDKKEEGETNEVESKNEQEEESEEHNEEDEEEDVKEEEIVNEKENINEGENIKEEENIDEEENVNEEKNIIEEEDEKEEEDEDDEDKEPDEDKEVEHAVEEGHNEKEDNNENREGIQVKGENDENQDGEEEEAEEEEVIGKKEITGINEEKGDENEDKKNEINEGGFSLEETDEEFSLKEETDSMEIQNEEKEDINEKELNETGQRDDDDEEKDLEENNSDKNEEDNDNDVDENINNVGGDETVSHKNNDDVGSEAEEGNEDVEVTSDNEKDETGGLEDKTENVSETEGQEDGSEDENITNTGLKSTVGDDTKIEFKNEEINDGNKEIETESVDSINNGKEIINKKGKDTADEVALIKKLNDEINDLDETVESKSENYIQTKEEIDEKEILDNESESSSIEKTQAIEENLSKSSPNCVVGSLNGISSADSCKEHALEMCAKKKEEDQWCPAEKQHCRFKWLKAKGECCRKYECRDDGKHIGEKKINHSKKDEKEEDVKDTNLEVENRSKFIREKSSQEHKTVVHYVYQGEPSETILRAHHCQQKSICKVLQGKGLCETNNLLCDTKFTCDGAECKCIVSTSCGGKSALLTSVHMDELISSGATSVSLVKAEKEKCNPSVCEGQKIRNLCQRSSLSSCKVDLSCEDSCVCWINIGCKNRSNIMAVSDEKHSRQQQLILPSGMNTERITILMKRTEETSNKSEEQWHRLAKRECESVSHTFDLGCLKPRQAVSHVFCAPGKCTCYIEYGPCKEEQNIGLLNVLEEVGRAPNSSDGKVYNEESKIDQEKKESELKSQIEINEEEGVEEVTTKSSTHQEESKEAATEETLKEIEEEDGGDDIETENFEQDNESEQELETHLDEPKTEKGRLKKNKKEGFEHGFDYMTSDEYTKEDSNNDQITGDDYYDENGEDYADSEEESPEHTRKTFFQAHIFPQHMLESLKDGGNSSHFIPEDRCTKEDQCPRIEFFCGERDGTCQTDVDCAEKIEDDCLCKLTVRCQDV